MIKVCLICGEEFNILPSENNKRRYCSKKCSNSAVAKARSKEPVSVVCATCGKEEHVAPQRAIKYKCCSVPCLGKYNSIKHKTTVELVCVVCGNSFNTTKKYAGKRKTCGSKECVHTHFSNIRQGSANPNYIHGKSIGVKKAIRNTEYVGIVKGELGLDKIPTGFHIHHRDGNSENNGIDNLILYSQIDHLWVHFQASKLFLMLYSIGTIPSSALSYSDDVDRLSYLLNITLKDIVVVKSGELLENPEEDNQHPSVGNDLEVPTKVQRLGGEESTNNPPTSARHLECVSDDIVRAAHITLNESAELVDKEPLG